MKYSRYLVNYFAFIAFAALILPSLALAADAPRITKEEVKALLNDPSLMILDGRTDSEWKTTDRKIAGAVRIDPHDVKSWAGSIPKDKKIVVYCS